MFTLYYTAACHLCEEAQAVVMAGFAARCIAANALKMTDIADDEGLLERYGLLIPVLRAEASGLELNWPFGVDEVLRLLSVSQLR